MNKQEFSYTFEGSQNFNPFALTVVAESEKEARQRALNGVIAAVKKELQLKLKEGRDIDRYTKMLKALPVQTLPADPVDAFIGCWCKSVIEFFTPIFNDPREDHHLSVSFDVWILYAPVKVSVFNPYTIRISSCLDG